MSLKLDDYREAHVAENKEQAITNKMLEMIMHEYPEGIKVQDIEKIGKIAIKTSCYFGEVGLNQEAENILKVANICFEEFYKSLNEMVENKINRG